jgi:hypothetical protein
MVGRHGGSMDEELVRRAARDHGGYDDFGQATVTLTPTRPG